jgi:CO dehydrogenase/acetyl-CoA synthase beta subunit
MNNLFGKCLYFLEITIFIILGNEKVFKEIEKIFRKKEAIEETQEEFDKKDIEKFNTCFECKYFNK